ncbi:MAG TPA: T9SS type A sorting domain-containing protein, partial [Flavobacteriales bacterium]|nr:T9SS type A sorting domain-containing protein [Flavobacteriales bacterium]
MRKYLLLLALSGLHSANAQINVLWEARHDGAASNIDRVAGMYVDNSGNVYVTGSSYDAVSGYDIVTIKYDNAGNELWESTFNGSGNGSDNASGIAVDVSGNVYVSGTSYISGTNFDFCVIKYNSLGVQQWQIYNGGGFYDEARGITLDLAESPVVIGGFQATSSNTNFRTLKLNPLTGATTWVQDFSNSTNLDIATAITIDATNNYYVTGHSFQSGEDLNIRTIKYNSAGVLQWSTQYNANTTLDSYDMPVDIVLNSAGETFVLGTVFNGSVSDEDIIIVKYNTAGTVVGSVQLNGSANDKDTPNSLIVDASGTSIFVAGALKGTSTSEDFMVAKYNSSLVQQWIDKYNGAGSNYDEATNLVLDNTGTYLYATGYSFLSTSNNDYLTIKYDESTGNREWDTRFNGPANNSDQAGFIDVDAAGNVYVSGDSKGSGTNLDYSTIKYCQLTTVATVDQDTVCANTTVNFNVTGGSTVQWLAPTTGLSCTTCATPSATLTADVCYYVQTQDAGGCIDKDTVCVIVNPLPGPVITPDGPTTFCVGDSVSLTASGFASYTWNTGETTATITTDTAGTYTVTVTDASGCQNFTNINVNVNALPVISAGADDAHCQGDSTQLMATGGTTYSWNADPYLSSTTIANPYVDPYTPGNYTFIVTGSDAIGCSSTDTVMITVNPLPVTPILFRPGGSPDNIYATNLTGGLTVDWYQNGVYLPAAGTGGTFPLGDTTTSWGCAPGPNDYFAQYTDANGCKSEFSDTLTVDSVQTADCYIGIVEIPFIEQLTVYPNPTTNQVTVEFSTQNAEGVKLSVYDISGKVVMTRLLKGTYGLRKEVIDLEVFGKGTYQLVLNGQDGKLANLV